MSEPTPFPELQAAALDFVGRVCAARRRSGKSTPICIEVNVPGQLPVAVRERIRHDVAVAAHRLLPAVPCAPVVFTPVPGLPGFVVHSRDGVPEIAERAEPITWSAGPDGPGARQDLAPTAPHVRTKVAAVGSDGVPVIENAVYLLLDLDGIPSRHLLDDNGAWRHFGRPVPGASRHAGSPEPITIPAAMRPIPRGWLLEARFVGDAVEVRRTAERADCSITLGERRIDPSGPVVKLAESGELTYLVGADSATLRYRLKRRDGR